MWGETRAERPRRLIGATLALTRGSVDRSCAAASDGSGAAYAGGERPARQGMSRTAAVASWRSASAAASIFGTIHRR